MENEIRIQQSPGLMTFAFRSSEISRLLFVFDPYGGTDQLGMFLLSLKRTVDVLSLSSEPFRQLVRLRSFPACWRQVKVTPIPVGPPSSFVANY